MISSFGARRFALGLKDVMMCTCFGNRSLQGDSTLIISNRTCLRSSMVGIHVFYESSCLNCKYEVLNWGILSCVGMSPHGGAGIGLERVVFLYLGRYTLLFMCQICMFVLIIILNVCNVTVKVWTMFAKPACFPAPLVD